MVIGNPTVTKGKAQLSREIFQTSYGVINGDAPHTGYEETEISVKRDQYNSKGRIDEIVGILGAKGGVMALGSTAPDDVGDLGSLMGLGSDEAIRYKRHGESDNAPKKITARIGDNPSNIGGLKRDEIHKVIKRNMPQIQYCYDRQLTKNPSLKGKMTVEFVIAKWDHQNRPSSHRR